MSNARWTYIDQSGTRTIVVEIAGPRALEQRRVEVEAVLDLDANGDVTGVEILDLARQAGFTELRRATTEAGSEVRVSYDEESDAIYLRLPEGRTVEQRVVDATVMFDVDGRLVRVEARVEPP